VHGCQDKPGARRLLGALVRPVPRPWPPSSRRSPASHGDQLEIVKLNTDENPDGHRQARHHEHPDDAPLQVGGEIVKTIVGAMPKPKLLRELEPFLG
jgi:hypothetical protein